tara:strand:- start:869 stop:1543 length:675 start_codon:yes stop_codon:yes gene_type:complete
MFLNQTKRNMQIRAIMFDLDGTLIDQFDAIHRSFSKVLVKMGFPEPSFETVKRAVGGASENTMSKLVGPERAKEAVQLLRPIFELEMLNGLVALPGSLEILQTCSDLGIRTAVLTNKHGPHARTACSHLGFDSHLELVIGANDTEWKKPEPQLTHRTLELLSAQIESTIYVGDSPYDYETAKAVGMNAYLVSTGTHSFAELSALPGSVVSPNLDQLSHDLLKSK